MSRPKPPPVPVGSHAHHLQRRLEGARESLGSFGTGTPAPARPSGLPPAAAAVAEVRRGARSAF